MTEKYITIEGNIGSGKSTLVDMLSKNETIECLQEPVHKWLEMKDDDGENILSKFYKDTPRWAYSFQMNAFITRAHDIVEKRKELGEGKILVGERSVITDRLVFAKLLNESGKIGKMEWTLYNQWYNWLTTDYKLKPDKIYYLYATPEISYERLKKRNRSEETGIALDYLKELHEKHLEWLVPKEYRNKLEEKEWIHFEFESEEYGPIVVLNGNIDYEERPEYKTELVKLIHG